MRKLRGSDVSMIFQEPMSSLNPVHRVGNQVAEAIRQHEEVSKEDAMQRVVELFEEVGIPDPEERNSTIRPDENTLKETKYSKYENNKQ